MNNSKKAVLPLPEMFPEDMFFSRYFLETEKNIKDFSFVKWLKHLDVDTLQMLESSTEKARQDDFSEYVKEDDVGVDIVLLICLVLAKEEGTIFPNIEDFSSVFTAERISEVSGRLIASVLCESLRRKGLMNFEKDGTLSKGDTIVVTTELGKAIISKMGNNFKLPNDYEKDKNI